MMEYDGANEQREGLGEVPRKHVLEGRIYVLYTLDIYCNCVCICARMHVPP